MTRGGRPAPGEGAGRRGRRSGELLVRAGALEGGGQEGRLDDLRRAGLDPHDVADRVGLAEAEVDLGRVDEALLGPRRVAEHQRVALVAVGHALRELDDRRLDGLATLAGVAAEVVRRVERVLQGRLPAVRLVQLRELREEPVAALLALVDLAEDLGEVEAVELVQREVEAERGGHHPRRLARPVGAGEREEVGRRVGEVRLGRGEGLHGPMRGDLVERAGAVGLLGLLGVSNHVNQDVHGSAPV